MNSDHIIVTTIGEGFEPLLQHRHPPIIYRLQPYPTKDHLVGLYNDGLIEIQKKKHFESIGMRRLI